MNILKEKVLATKGEWVAVAQLVSYNTKKTGKIRDVQLVFNKDPLYKSSNTFPTGWSIEELALLHSKLFEWKKEIGEIF